MRVILIDVNCRYSSTGKIVYDLYTECRKAGHEAAVCYGRGNKLNEDNIYKFGLEIETWFHALMTRITGLTGCFSFFSTRRLLKFIKQFKPDVVHVHELHAYFVNLAPVVLYLKRNNIKTVWTFHCEFMYTGKCGYAFDCKKWMTECGHCPKLGEYPSSLFFDFTKKMFNQKKRMFDDFGSLSIVTPSDWLADRVMQSFLGDWNIRVIHNGIDTENDFFPRTVDHLKAKYHIGDEKVILAVAPDLLSERKGGQWVLKLAEMMENERVKFVLIGIEDLNQSFGKNVTPMGPIKNQQVLAEFYSLADLFLICSKKENFPTTCIEALACGVPVIGFDEGGTKETAPEGYGFFLPYGDVGSLKELIQLIIHDQIKLKSKVECAEYGRSHYGKRVMAQNYLELYAEMNGEKSCL